MLIQYFKLIKATKVIMRRMFRIGGVLFIYEISFYLSFCPCTRKRGLHRSLFVFVFLIAMKVRPPTILPSWGMLRIEINANDFIASRLSISSLTAFWIFNEVHLDQFLRGLLWVVWGIYVKQCVWILSFSCHVSSRDYLQKEWMVIWRWGYIL